MERRGDHRREYDAGSCAHTGKHTTEVQRVAIHGVSQREKRNDDIREAREPKVQIREPKFLGDRITVTKTLRITTVSQKGSRQRLRITRTAS